MSKALDRYIRLRREATDLRTAGECDPIGDEVVALMVIAEIVSERLGGIEQSLDLQN